MKYLLLSALLLASNSFAATPSDETRNLARLLINSPAVVGQLQKGNIDALINIERTEEKQGVNRYVLTFRRYCECIPATATVKVREDLTPTYVDGLPIYESSVEIKEGL